MKPSNPIDIKEQQRRQETVEAERQRNREQEIADLQKLMGSPWGRRFMWRLLAQAGVFQSSFTGNSETFFREGRRDIGLKQLADIHDHCPDEYLVMLQERKSK